MKTVLDLVGEFATLNDQKVRTGGELAPQSEKRWAELKAFYDLLTAHNGIPRRPVTHHFSADDIRRRVKHRRRLRVPTDLCIVFKLGDEFLSGQILNVSRGGVFLATQQMIPVEAKVVVFLTNPYNASLIEAQGKVVWTTDRVKGTSLPLGMGMWLGENDAQGLIRSELDSMVIETLEQHLEGLDASTIAPYFLERESLIL